MTRAKVFWENPIVRCLSCRMFRKQTHLEKSLKVGEKIVEKQLDVRSLIMTQNLLLTTIKLLIKPKAKRELMRI